MWLCSGIGFKRLQVAGTSVVTSGRLIRVADGAVSSPSISFSADTNTGMYRSATDTLKFTTAGSDRMTISSTGNVGIGTPSPASMLTVSNGTYSGNSLYTLSVSGLAAKNSGTAWTAVSDGRLKNIVGKIDGLSIVNKLKPIKYTWNDLGLKKQGLNDSSIKFGFIAQDVQKIVPEWVIEDSEGYLALNMDGEISVVVSAIQEQQKQIEILKEENIELHKEIEEIILKLG